MKRIVTIQDLTCLGKCALTVALPVISAMGVEPSVIPTSVLSVHTEFPEFIARDMPALIPQVAESWKRQNVHFDGIYTGYIGSPEQMEQISVFIDQFKRQDTLIFIDPVLGDTGSFYPGFDVAFSQAMAQLCAKADIIVPNLTEAALLLGRPCLEEGYSREDIQTLLQDLTQLGVPKVILTGVGLEENRLGVMAYDSQSGQYFSHFSKKHPLRFHGTGDVFASTCFAALTRGASLEQALTLAVNFVSESISASLQDPNRRWYSVNFEQALGYLVEQAKTLPN